MGSTNISILKENLDNLTNTYDRSLSYKKYKTFAKVKCFNCDSEIKVSHQQLNEIRKAKMCPCCFEEVSIHKEAYTSQNEKIVRIGDEGYYTKVIKQVSKPTKVKIKQVAYWIGNKFYARYIRNNCFGGFIYDENQDTDYRLRYGNNMYSLRNLFDDIKFYSKRNIETKTYKKWLDEKRFETINFKSNQKKIIMSHFLNENQILAIRNFDLKSYDDVSKYSAYINKQSFLSDDKILNVYYLDYLKRNNINYRTFLDYCGFLEKLNMKLDKPKDFNKAHNEASRKARLLQEKENSKKIQKVYESLINKSYLKGKYQIRPIKSAEDLIESGKELHNCLGTYISKYANRQCDLYVLIENKELIGAIEVRHKKLIQALGKFNDDLKPYQNKIVKDWMKLAYA